MGRKDSPSIQPEDTPGLRRRYTDPPVPLEILAQLIEGNITGHQNKEISSCKSLEDAQGEQIALFNHKNYLPALNYTEAGVIITSESLFLSLPDPLKEKTFLLVDDPGQAMATIACYLHPLIYPSEQSIHPSAVIEESAQIGDKVVVMAHVYIGARATIGDGSVLFPSCYLGPDVILGRKCILQPQVVVLDDCRLGDKVYINAGTIIGSQGFGFHQTGNVFDKIPQIGRVTIGSEVEIGANCAIDRATYSTTFIDNGCKLDNLIQVGHNVSIGNNCAIAAQSGMAGSVTIGPGTIIGGQAGIADHLEIGSQSTLAGRAGVTRNLAGKEVYAGFPAIPHSRWIRQKAQLNQIDKLSARVKKLEQKIDDLNGQKTQDQEPGQNLL